MRFKSAKFCFKPCIELALVLGSALASVSAFALTATPMSADGMTGLNNTQYGMTLYYYPSSTVTLNSSLFLDTSDLSMPMHAFDLTQDQKTQLLTTGTTPDMLKFQVASTATLTPPVAPQQTYIAAYAGGGSGQHAVPIAFMEFFPFASYGGGNCTNLNCQGSVLPPNGYTYYLAALYNNPTIPVQVGIYPKDVCYYYKYVTGGQDAYGCSNGVPTTGGAMSLTFAVVSVDSTVPTNVPADNFQSAAPLDQASLSVEFVSAGTAITACPSYTDIYFPGDTRIMFNANSGNNLFTYTTPSGAAPITNVVVVGNVAPTAAAQVGNYTTADSVNAPVAIGPSQPIGGFMNTTTGTDNKYNMGFMLRDAAGLISANGCGVSGVQTATIQGFLKKSGCFIATAAFDSIDAAPVAMLRDFRDRVLLHSAPGKIFVSWYYHWSPEAAEWLLRHPLFRFPVLLALIPLEVLAWLVLHPAWMALLAALNIVIFVRGIRGWKGAVGES